MAILNVTLAARMVAETELFRVPEIAKRHGVHGQTVRNHLERERKGLEPGAEPALADFADVCRRERELLRVEAERRRHEWADLSVSSLRALLEAIQVAAEKSKAEFDAGKVEKGRIRELAGAVKIIGDLDLGKRLLFGSRGSGADAPVSEATGAARRGASTSH